jgi:hypothetical protein
LNKGSTLTTVSRKLDVGRAGQGRAGEGRAGQGRAGQGRAGQGRAGQGKEESKGLSGLDDRPFQNSLMFVGKASLW